MTGQVLPWAVPPLAHGFARWPLLRSCVFRARTARPVCQSLTLSRRAKPMPTLPLCSQGTQKMALVHSGPIHSPRWFVSFPCFAKNCANGWQERQTTVSPTSSSKRSPLLMLARNGLLPQRFELSTRRCSRVRARGHSIAPRLFVAPSLCWRQAYPQRLSPWSTSALMTSMT